uniref:Uncharacterized protein n=1 Tax=Rhizophora mucronata TaxID=61149 RepID=A0A2P2MYI1_RHIMU
MTEQNREKGELITFLKCGQDRDIAHPSHFTKSCQGLIRHAIG